MLRTISARLGPILLVVALIGSLAPSALVWRLASTSTASIAHNQGITFDQGAANSWFTGTLSTANTGLDRANARLSQAAANSAVIPANKPGYNHAGDLTFDPKSASNDATRGQSRVLLPLECYCPNRSPSNTCGTGGIAVADRVSLKARYYGDLAGIAKAMWAEITPDSKWILTSTGTQLLVYDAAQITTTAAGETISPAATLNVVLPSGNVPGAAFYQNRLFLSLDLGTSFKVVSYDMGADFRSPTGSATTEITETRSSSNNEPEGLAVTTPVLGSYPLGGALHWQMLPSIPLYSRILNYTP
jgi:hypothetical protein